MWSTAGWMPGVVARAASVRPCCPVPTVKLPCRFMVALIWAVAWGVVGPVSASACEAETPAGRIVIDTAWLAWLVTMNTTGPAPVADGETETRWSLMYPLTLTGLGGRGRLAK